MNSFYKHMNALLIGTMIITTVPAYSMENELDVVVVEYDAVELEENQVVWYKKRPAQMAAAALTTALAIYSYAVYKGKASSPAVLWAGLFCSHVAITIATQPQEEIITVENTGNDTKVMIVVSNDSHHPQQDQQTMHDDSHTTITQEDPKTTHADNKTIAQEEVAVDYNTTFAQQVDALAVQIKPLVDQLKNKASAFKNTFKNKTIEWAQSDSVGTDQ